MSKNYNEKLITCALNGNLRGIKSALRRGADINYATLSFSVLTAASSKNHHKIVKFLLEHGAVVDAVIKYGRKSALLFASENGHIQSTKVLLEHGAHVDLQDHLGKSALMLASQEGNEKVIKMLLEHGAQVDLQDNTGKSALMHSALIYEIIQNFPGIANMLLQAGVQVDHNAVLKLACEEENERIVEKSLEQGAQVDLQDMFGNNGKSALMVACQKGNERIVKILLGHGAKVDLQDNAGKSALMLACEERNYNSRIVLELLNKGARVDLQDNRGRSALMLAYLKENHVVHELFKFNKGAQVDLQDNAGKSALMLACGKENEKIIIELLNEGAQVDLQDNAGISALMLACEKENEKIAIELLNQGARADLQDNAGKSALMRIKHNLRISYALNGGAQMDLQDNAGKTAMILACEEGNERIVLELLNQGAQVDLQDIHGKSALIHAVSKYYPRCGPNRDYYETYNGDIELSSGENERKYIFKHLLKHGAQVNLQDHAGETALMHAIEGIDSACNNIRAPMGENKQRIDMLLEHGAKVDLQNNTGRSALMLACRGGAFLKVRILLDNGVQVDLQDNAGKSALMYATSSTITKMLLQGEAQVDLQDNSGKTALMLACQEEDDIIVQILLKKGAKINLQDNNGKSALMVASDKGNTECVDMLLKHKAIVDLQDNDRRTALSFASDVKTTKVLLHGGAQVDLQDYTGKSANLHVLEMIKSCEVEHLIKLVDRELADKAKKVASQNWNTCSISTLLTHKTLNVNLQDNQGWSVLMRACEGGVTSVVEQLLEKGVKLDLQNNRKQTALMIASQEGYADITDILLRRGAQVSLQDNNGRTALMTAICSDQQVPLQLYMNLNTSLDIVKILLNFEEQVDMQDKDGKSALMMASEEGDAECVHLLLGHGANVNLQDKHGNSALMTACQNGNAATAAILLDADADVYLRNTKGKTAVEIAMHKKNSEVLRSFTKLKSKTSFPGILFSEGVKKETITSAEKDISLEEVGISLSIPKDAVSSTDPPVEIQIQPCFSGSWELPMGVELVSPAYIVKPNREVEFKKNVLVKIWHHANLESEEDCEDMAFLTASSTPEYRGTCPVYVFREIKGVQGSFTPRQEQPVGEIGLKHFCIVGIGEKRRRDDNSDAETEEPEAKRLLKGKASLSNHACNNCAMLLDNTENLNTENLNTENLYSVRMYKAIEKESTTYKAMEKRSIIFCICLYQHLYIKVSNWHHSSNNPKCLLQYCDRVIACNYCYDKPVVLDGVTITEDKVSIEQCEKVTEWTTFCNNNPAMVK